MLKIVAFVFAGLLLVVGGLAATKPDNFRIERSATIKAPPDKVFALVNDFHHWSEWSPWEKLDPSMTRTHSGAASGPGAAYAWTGNDKVGAGRMEIVESSPPAKLSIRLEFERPFKASNVAKYTFDAAGDATRVTWAMLGKNMFLSKLMSVFVDMDKMIGRDFETGLANLKALAEK